MRGLGDMDYAIGELSRPGALTAALSWYRANASPASQLLEAPPVPVDARDALNALLLDFLKGVPGWDGLGDF